jgi:hypothetical protein
MNTIQKRFLLFLIGCIGTRSLFVYLAKIANTTYLRYLGYLALLPLSDFFIFILQAQDKQGLKYLAPKYGGMI